MALGLTQPEVAASARAAGLWTIRSGAKRTAAVAGRTEAVFRAWLALPNDLLNDSRLCDMARALEALQRALGDDEEIRE